MGNTSCLVGAAFTDAPFRVARSATPVSPRPSRPVGRFEPGRHRDYSHDSSQSSLESRVARYAQLTVVVGILQVLAGGRPSAKVPELKRQLIGDAA